MLREAFAHAQAMLNAPKAVEASVERPHCATAVIGARGGVGASTIATSLAWLLSERGKRATALLDLDVHFGTGALALDLEPGRGLTDAIENPRSEEHTSELQSLMRISYAVFCLKKKK